MIHDMVNSPAHYTQGDIECIDAIEAATIGKSGFEGALVANVIKYLWRYEAKNGLQDVQKANWYLSRLVAHLKAKNVTSERVEARDWPNEQRRQASEAEDATIWPTKERIDIIGQNGPTAESYAIVCASCRGTGRIVDGNRTMECPVCDGKPGGWLWPRIAP